ncbi:ChbG/HpnK family deacetylase [Hoeflea alexandrii]|uniref:ChbG/HpnK family deacetylase n=1 Tax=Hoeflea alexandrii TaxID=288436 RepID=UPI0022AF1154|nr:ChbG/HpnK family deacetylase [Hoeflea alexandrii]MCZ4291300.1 ChbG/HpnK family deacetylase [Hoeflea alexandrii]
MQLRIADDFGLGRKHDRVILSLMQARRLDATSVMVNDAIDAGDVARLKALRDAGAEVGLHLNLTQALPGHADVWPLSTLLRPRLPSRVRAAAAASLNRQTDEFISLFGSFPDYYDGHQHCHCIPWIAPLVAQLPSGPKTWIRVPLPATWTGRWRNLRAGGAKGVLIMALAARARRVFRQAGHEVNEDFSGFLRLDDPASVRHWLPRLLAAAGPDCLMMVHPGDADDEMQCAGHAPESRDCETNILLQGTVN